jgi:hypothetical protein
MLIGGGLGVLWALAVVIVPGLGPQPFIPVNLALIYAFAPAGMIMALMILTIAIRRFRNEARADGSAFAPGSGGDIDQRVLSNSVEQMVLALLLWPFAAMQLGAVTLIVLGIAMALSRLIYWLGYHVSPLLRLFGWSASFYPTVIATVWCIWRLLT